MPIRWKYQGHICQLQHSPKNLENWRKKEDLFSNKNTRRVKLSFNCPTNACCATESALTLVSVSTVLPTVAFLTMSLSLIILSPGTSYYIILYLFKSGNLSPAPQNPWLKPTLELIPFTLKSKRAPTSHSWHLLYDKLTSLFLCLGKDSVHMRPDWNDHRVETTMSGHLPCTR